MIIDKSVLMRTHPFQLMPRPHVRATTPKTEKFRPESERKKIWKWKMRFESEKYIKWKLKIYDLFKILSKLNQDHIHISINLSLHLFYVEFFKIKKWTFSFKFVFWFFFFMLWNLWTLIWLHIYVGPYGF